MGTWVRHFLEELFTAPSGWSQFGSASACVVSQPVSTSSPRFMGDRALKLPFVVANQRDGMSLDVVTADASRARVQGRFGFTTGVNLGLSATCGIAAGVRVSGSNTASLWQGYFFEARLVAAGTIAIVSAGIGSPTADVTLASTAFTFAPLTTYHVLFDATGSTFSLKVWADGTPEPAAYQLTVVDTALSSAGLVVIGTVSKTGAGSPPDACYLDYATFGTGGSAAPARPKSRVEYLDFLDSQDALRCSLAEIGVLGQSGNSTLEGRVCMSDIGFTSKPEDPYPNICYEEIITQRVKVKRRMTSSFTGVMQMSVGDLIFKNETRNSDSTTLGETLTQSLDGWLAYDWDGRPIRVLLGHPSWRRCDFRTRFYGTVDSIYKSDAYHLGFRVRGIEALFQNPLTRTTIGGTGPSANALLPIAVSGFFNAPLPLYDAATNTYQICQPNFTVPFGFTAPNFRIRDQGVRLDGGYSATGTVSAVNTGTDTITTANNHGLSVNADFYCVINAPAPLVSGTRYYVKTVPAANQVTLSATPGGATIDLTAWAGPTTYWYGVNGNYDYTTGRIALLATPAGQVTATFNAIGDGSLSFDIPTGTILTNVAAVLALGGYTLTRDIFHGGNFAQSVLIRENQQITIGALINKIVSSISASFCLTRDGVWYVAQLSTPTGTAAWNVVADDIRNWRTGERFKPRYVERHGWQPNNLQQTGADLAGSVTTALRELFGLPYSLQTYVPSETAFDQPANHLLAETPEERVTILGYGPDAAAEAQRKYTVYKKATGTYFFDTDAWATAMELGDELGITYTRDGFTSGKNAILVGMEDDGRMCTLEVFCQLDGIFPAVTSAAQPFIDPDYYALGEPGDLLLEDGTQMLDETGTNMTVEV